MRACNNFNLHNQTYVIMNRNYLLLIVAFLFSNYAFSQTASVQIIHNSPDPAVSTVDVYVNQGATPALDDFEFRTATGFIDLPAGVELQFGFAPANSSGPQDIILSLDPLTLTEGATYVATANGVLNPDDFNTFTNTNIGFNLDIWATGQTAASMPEMVDIIAFHGSTDAPAVDVVVGGAPLIPNLNFRAYSGYAGVPPAKYILNVTPAGANETIVASYMADLSGLTGGAAVVFASGFLDPSTNQDGEAFGLFAALPDGTVLELPAVNAPSMVINEVDYDQAGGDTAEFIELFNNGSEDVNLFGTSIDLWNGSNSQQYNSIALNDATVPAGAYYVVCFGENNAAYCDQSVAGGSVQNGGPDAIALAFQGQIFDALSYEGTIENVSEGSGDDLVDISAIDNFGLARIPNGFDSDNNGADFRAQCITPGAGNDSADFSCIAATANVQIIHNSPFAGTDAGPVVDIYLNGLPTLAAVPFRAATGFLALPAGVDVEVAIAVSPSTSVNDAIATFPLGALTEGENYIVIANGIVGDPNTPFNLEVKAGAKTVADDAATVEFQAFHGSPDAPNVDIGVRTVGTIFGDVAFGQFSDYIAVAPALYYVDVRAAGSPDIVATYAADLSGLVGGAATVFASGLLGNTPNFGLFAALPDGTVIELPAASVARVQVIHNSPSPTVDIYGNDDILLDDFAFRTASPFIFLPAGVEINLGVALDNSTSAADAIANFPVTLENGGTYVVTANGIVGDPDFPFGLAINDMGQERAADGEVEIAVLHGSPGAPNVDVDARLVGTLFTDVEYGEYDGYIAVPEDLYYLDVRATGSTDVVATFEANLAGLGGNAITVFASGLLGGDPAFGLFAALADGTVVELPATGAARAQIIHNSPSGTVDIYVDGALVLDDFEFLTATPFGWFRADIPVDIAVAPPTSTSVDDAIATFEDIVFEDRSTVVVVAAGEVANGTFDLFISEGKEASADPATFEAKVFHGSPDAPAVDVDDFFAGNVISDIAFGEFTDDYIGLLPQPFVLELLPAGTQDLVAQFFFNLTGGQGLAGVVFAGGFLAEDGDPRINLYVALSNGTVIPFIPVTLAQTIHNSAAAGAEVVDLYANGGIFVDDFAFQTATPYTFIVTRTPITIGVAGPTSTGPEEVFLNLPAVTLEDGKFYNIIAAGIPGDATTPFELFVQDNGRLGSESAATLDVSVFHGATDAPAVDVVARGIGTLLDGLAYGSYSDDYTSIPPANYFLEIRPDGSEETLVGTFNIDAQAFGGASAVIFASGTLSPDDDKDFDLLAALPDGTVLRLTPVAQAQVIHNSPTPTVDVYANDALFLDDFAFRSASPFVDLPTRVGIDLAVAGENSTSSADAIANFDGVTLEDGKVYIIMATGVVGDPDTPFDLAIFDEGRTASDGGVDLLLYHGSPDAPEVDVVAQGVGVIYDNVEYGEFDGYLNVPANTYTLDVTPSNDNDVIVKRYTADVTGLEGGAATVFASGFLGSEEPADGFQVWVALPDGTTFPLDELVSTNELANEVRSFTIIPNPARDLAEVNYSLDATLDVTLNIYDATGRLIQSQYAGKQNEGAYTYPLDVSRLAAGLYNYSIVTPQGILTKRFTVVK